AAVCCASVGLMTGYWPLALCLLLTGLGIGAFHPQGAALARKAGRGSGLAMSAFTVGGNIGYGVAPPIATLYMAVLGLPHFYFAALPGLLIAAFLALTFRPESAHVLPRAQADGRDATASNRTALWLLTGTVVVRSAVQIGMTTFLPFLAG